MLIVLPDELDILRDMQPLDRDIFNYLAERIDFDSGVVGVSRRVSYGGMAYDLSEHEGERRSPDSLRRVTSKQAENSIQRLVNRGLLVRKSKGGFNQPLQLVRVFWANLLGLGHCAQKPDGSQLGVLLGVLNKINSNNNNGLETVQADSREREYEPVGTTSYNNINNNTRDQFSMFAEWKPDIDDLEFILFRAGYSPEKINPIWINEFVDYWRSECRRRQTQEMWTKQLAYRLIAYLREPGLFDRLHGVNQPARTGNKKPASGLPDWASPPRDDEALCGWMRRHGYGEGPPGLAYFQTRHWLKCQIESRLKQWRTLQ